ncbi:queuosine salvage family protein [Desulfoferrobacter suflitae]|uniref:queuosine salvage family protein n=1 Tax=Desulfoferrobacter suflitae TaxID=2865782 RepID=UPI002164E683|nr:queuosine salvage family protein [Desulfoferrobacter suflitae]MCK8601294.1 queuosine salvage family protein [Desulfoferrobacter suflitae]
MSNCATAADPLAEVRAACRLVAERAEQVTINRPAVAAYVQALPLEQAALPALDAEAHYVGFGDDTVAFLVTLDAINFGSGYFPHLRKKPNRSGYFTIATALTEFYRNHGPLSARQLVRLSPEDCARIFGQDLSNEPVAELMRLFASALNDLGRYLLDRFAGSFIRLIEAAAGSAARLTKLLTEMPFFNDVLSYDKLRVPFFKRAQLTAADLAIAFEGKGPGRFNDLQRLTLFADNLVPHVLRVDGLLLYTEQLAARIDAAQLIPRGSKEEVELRACALHAVELMVAELTRAGREISPMQLDYLLWNRGQQPYYKKIHPRHRTRTVFY